MEKLIITIPKPCNESWDAMTPVENGRYCAHCQKKVIDFSRMPDAEVIRIFRDATDGPPCGRFHISQVGRELVHPKKVSFGSYLLQRVAASFLFFQAIVTTAWSQTAKPKTHLSPKATDTKQKQKNIAVRGKVLDADGDVPLKGIIVSAEGYSCTTNAKGIFMLQFPNRYFNRTVVLECRYPKFLTAPDDMSAFENYELILDPAKTKEIVMHRDRMVFIEEPRDKEYLTGAPPICPQKPDSNFMKKKTKVSAEGDTVQGGKMKQQ